MHLPVANVHLRSFPSVRQFHLAWRRASNRTWRKGTEATRIVRVAGPPTLTRLRRPRDSISIRTRRRRRQPTVPAESMSILALDLDLRARAHIN